MSVAPLLSCCFCSVTGNWRWNGTQTRTRTIRRRQKRSLKRWPRPTKFSLTVGPNISGAFLWVHAGFLPENSPGFFISLSVLYFCLFVCVLLFLIITIFCHFFYSIYCKCIIKLIFFIVIYIYTYKCVYINVCDISSSESKREAYDRYGSEILRDTGKLPSV